MPRKAKNQAKELMTAAGWVIKKGDVVCFYVGRRKLTGRALAFSGPKDAAFGVWLKVGKKQYYRTNRAMLFGP